MTFTAHMLAATASPVLHELVTETAALLDSLHDLPPLPDGSRLLVGEHDTCMFGASRPDLAVIGMPAECMMMPYLLHEVGHWLDMLLGGCHVYRTAEDVMLPRFGSDKLVSWKRAVEASDMHRQLMLASLTGNAAAAQSRYVLQGHELFAMTYAQWALTRLGRLDELAPTLVDFRRRSGRADLGIWDAEDFAPIAREIQSALGCSSLAAAGPIHTA